MIGDLTKLSNTCMSNAPVWGLVFYVNPPVLPPIAPGRGVVGQYIDRCISLWCCIIRILSRRKMVSGDWSTPLPRAQANSW